MKYIDFSMENDISYKDKSIYNLSVLDEVYTFVIPLCIGSNPIFRPIFERLNLYGFIIKRLGNSFENPSFFVHSF